MPKPSSAGTNSTATVDPDEWSVTVHPFGYDTTNAPEGSVYEDHDDSPAGVAGTAEVGAPFRVGVTPDPAGPLEHQDRPTVIDATTTRVPSRRPHPREATAASPISGGRGRY
jgi:hypothetical protein